MPKKGHTEEQIVAVLREVEAGVDRYLEEQCAKLRSSVQFSRVPCSPEPPSTFEHSGGFGDITARVRRNTSFVVYKPDIFQ